MQMHTLQKCVKIVQPFLTLYLPRAIPASRKHKAALATTCPSQLYGTRIQKKPQFLHVQLLLQPPDATAASQLGAGGCGCRAPRSALLGNGHYMESLITRSCTTSSPEQVSFGRG